MISASEAKRIALDARKEREGDARLEATVDAAITHEFGKFPSDAQRVVIVVDVHGTDPKCVERVRRLYACNGWCTRVDDKAPALELWVDP